MSIPTFVLHGAGAADLAPGTWLLEASAGTGKTYTIVGIVLRLVLEAGIPIERCVVMTFTRAATAELRERLRRGLHQALAAVEGEAVADPFIADLGRRFADDHQARRQLLLAIAGLDAALIATIHGVCHRLLGDHALHAGIPLDADLDRDLADWRTQTVHDLLRGWTRRLSPAGAALVGKGLAPAACLAACERLERHPDVVTEGLAAADAATVEATLAEARTQFPVWRRDLTAFFLERSAILGAAKPYGPRDLAQRLDAIAAALAGTPDPDVLADLLRPYLDPNHQTERLQPHHRTALEATPWHRGLRALVDLPAAARRDVVERYADALRRRPRLSQHLHFSDLLVALDGALGGETGADLRRSVGERYDAVLVDEFQDTDPVQWRILDHLFAAPGKRLFLIGDPKQAIYAFRGADVHAYLDVAASDDLRRATLGVNFRSDADLVAAVNACFDRGPTTFVEEAIRFQPVAAAHGTRLRGAGPDPRPLQLWWQESGLRSDDTRLALAQAVAAEIRRLLAGAERAVGGTWQRLRPRDCAILVRTHHEGDLVAAVLGEGPQPIASVRTIRTSVFAGNTAHEVATVLAAILAPHRDRAVRAAALTRLAGLAVADLLGDQAPKLDALVQRLRDLRVRWFASGFLNAWQEVLDGGLTTTSPRVLLAGAHDGERALTDLLHLGDLLGAAEADLRLGPDALLDWLQRHLAGEDSGDDDQVLRLDRDDEAVRILTIHTSKGLEFPVVFLPFLWSGSAPDPDQIYHRDHQARWWFGSHRPPEVEQAQTREHLAETLRLAYVALTRAAQRCYVAFAPQPKSSNGRGCLTSALTWLGLQTSKGVAVTAIDRIDAKDRAWQARQRAAFTHPQIAVLPTPATDGGTLPMAEATVTVERPLAPWLPRRRERWFSSYSGLVRNRPVDEPDHDQVRCETAIADDPLPRGARFGTALHRAFETIDFAADRAAWRAPAAAALREQGFDDTHADRLVLLIDRVLACPLPEDGTPLRQVARRRQAEIEVLLPVARPGALERAFADHGGPWSAYAADIADLTLSAGYFTGIIDLVFTHGGRVHLLDWKSNDLGRRGGYHAEAMVAEMRLHHYVLQYHLYAVAVHRLLRRRLVDYDYDRHVGAAHYCFVRGMDADGAGWYRARPSRAMIEALDACFGGLPDGR